MPRTFPFILPAIPLPRATPPSGREWLHEVKFDGYRAQLHKWGEEVALLSKNGKHLVGRFTAIKKAIQTLPARNLIIDAELIACNDQGLPDFRALHSKRSDARLCICAFDILQCDDQDLRSLPLVARRVKLGTLLKKQQTPLLHFSDSFSDPDKLLAACNEQGLEGIVSKKKDAPYTSGNRSGWIKVKCSQWKEANKDRGVLFGEMREKA